MKAKTYQEWREIGYQVRKGETNSGWNKVGAPTYTREQVEESGRFDRPASGTRVYNPDFPDE